MKNDVMLYDDGSHKCIMFSFDEEHNEERFLSVNQYLIIHEGKGMLIDPGSECAFDEMVDAITRHIPLSDIAFIFFSHQDPDVAGAIHLWSNATPAKLIVSKLWTRFMGHYGLMDTSRLIPLEDFGAMIPIGEDYFHFISAHFLHSPGNFSLFDSRSKILFSGDIGAAIVGLEHLYKEVEDFDAHLPYLQAFHTRYMAGNRFTKAWTKAVRTYEPSVIAPQHGALLKGVHVRQFFEWFETLQCGGDLIETLYNENQHD